MTSFALVVLQAVAITIVFVKGTIFKRVRESGPVLWRELAGCVLCSGVWIGAGWRLLHLQAGAVNWRVEALDTLAAGAASGTSALLVTLVLAVLDKHS